MTRTFLLLGVVGLAMLAIIRPWTIRPIAGATAPAFDPAAYVTSIWDTRVRQALSDAVPIESLAKSQLVSARSLVVQGVGKISSANSSSRVGLVHVRFVDDVEADVQVGPVIRGTVVRDALPFIHFSDFANQIEYAQVASLLNERVLAQVRQLPAPQALVGQRVRIVGALSTAGPSWEITPITFELTGGAK